MGQGRGTAWGEMYDDAGKLWKVRGAFDWVGYPATLDEPADFDSDLDWESIEVVDPDTDEELFGKELSEFREHNIERIEKALREGHEAGNWEEDQPPEDERR